MAKVRGQDLAGRFLAAPSRLSAVVLLDEQTSDLVGADG